MRRGVIRIGDPLSSGGQVVSACSLFKVDGKEVAGVGDACHCNRHGDVKIVEGIETFTFFGKKLALHGCKASCGCSIISTTELMVVDTGGGSAAQEGQPEPPRAAGTETKQALTLTETGAQSPQPDPCNDIILGNQKGYDDLKNLFKLAGYGFQQTERSSWVTKDSTGAYSGMTIWPWSAARRKETWSGPVPTGTFANVHTHPMGTDPWPSTTGGPSGRGDLPVNDMGYLIYILSRQGIYMRAPEDASPTQLAGPNWMEKPPCSNMKK